MLTFVDIEIFDVNVNERRQGVARTPPHFSTFETFSSMERPGGQAAEGWHEWTDFGRHCLQLCRGSEGSNREGGGAEAGKEGYPKGTM